MDVIDRPADTVTSEPPRDDGEVINNRYLIERCIGTGGMGAVYLVRDVREDRRLALKRLRKDRADQGTLDLLRNEFLTLTRLRHPNIARVYEFGIDRASSDLFFTTEFVEGVDWLSAVKDLKLERRAAFVFFLRQVVQVLRGLEFIHSRGLVHCDVKPENILIAGGDGAEADVAKLIDFGLVKRERVRSGRKVLGTPYYVAPETILGSPVDRRADLYSLGVVLYQLVTGRPPFRGESNLAVLRSHVETRPVPPHELHPELSRQFSEVILRLMEKNPERRFQGALEIVDAINAAFSTEFPLETEATLKSYLDDAWLVGRESEREALQRIFRASVRPESLLADSSRSRGASSPAPPEALPGGAAGGASAPRGRMILLSGERGSGKTRLASELRYVAETEGASCLSVVCDAPHTGPCVQELGRFLSELKSLEPEGQASGRPYLQRAALFIRALSREGSKPRVRGAESELQSIVRGLLEVTRERPIVLYLYHLHSAGELLTRVIDLVVQAQAEEWVPGSRLLVVGVLPETPDRERSGFHQLRSTEQFRSNTLEISLARLRRADVGRLIRGAFTGSKFPEGFDRRVYEESDGNTGVVLEILEFLLERQNVWRLATGWGLDRDYESIAMPGRVRAALEESLAKLPGPVLHLGIALASMEHVHVLEVAGAIAGVSERNLLRYAAQLIRDRIIQEHTDHRSRSSYSFVHQSAKRMLYSRIAAANRSAIHHRIGTLLEDYYATRGEENHKELAFHFLKARDREKGVRYGLEAADEYAREFSPLQAIETYKTVLSLSEEQDHGLRNGVRRQIAALRLYVGDYRGVLDLLEPLCAPEANVEGIQDETALFLQVARAQTHLGAFEKARQLIERRLEVEATTEGSKLLAEALLELAVLNCAEGKTVASLRCCHRLEEMTQDAPDVSRDIELYMLLAENHARLNDPESAAGYCQRALRLIDAQHETDLLALSCYCRGKFYRFAHQYQNSVKQFQLSLMLRGRMRIFDGQADCLVELGALELELGAPQKASAHLEKASTIYDRTGNLRGTIAGLCLLGEVDRLLGRYSRGRERLKDALRLSRPLADQELAQEALTSLAGICADRGDVAGAEKYLARAEGRAAKKGGASPNDVKRIGLRSDLAFWRGDFTGAVRHCDQGLQVARDLRDPAATARYLVRRCQLSARLAYYGEARRTIASLMEISRRHGLALEEGWARLIEGIVLGQELKIEPAENSFAQATDLLIAHGSERDIAALYLEYGLFCLKKRDHEQSYLNLEEGFYLARNLDLSYFKCRFFYARGLLEASLWESSQSRESSRRAEDSLRFAANLSARAPYQEVRWQVHYHFGRLLSGEERMGEARKHFEVALNSVREVLANMPAQYRATYMAHWPVASLESAAGQPVK